VEEITGGWRKLHKDELRDFFYNVFLVCDEIKEDKIGTACYRHGEEGICLLDFGGVPAGKKPTGIHRY